MADTQVDGIDTTLLTLKGISDRPVYCEQFRESAVACQSEAVMELRLNGRPQLVESRNAAALPRRKSRSPRDVSYLGPARPWASAIPGTGAWNVVNVMSSRGPHSHGDCRGVADRAVMVCYYTKSSKLHFWKHES